MKKWIVFLSISCALLIFVFSIQCHALHRFLSSWNEIKDALQCTNKEMFGLYEGTGTVPHNICVFISALFTIVLLGSNIFLLVTIAMKKITPFSIGENLAAWKQHSAEKKAQRQQRKLEKAKSKVEQLESQMEKDDN